MIKPKCKEMICKEDLTKFIQDRLTKVIKDKEFYNDSEMVNFYFGSESELITIQSYLDDTKEKVLNVSYNQLHILFDTILKKKHDINLNKLQAIDYAEQDLYYETDEQLKEIIKGVNSKELQSLYLDYYEKHLGVTLLLRYINNLMESKSIGLLTIYSILYLSGKRGTEIIDFIKREFLLVNLEGETY